MSEGVSAAGRVPSRARWWAIAVVALVVVVVLVVALAGSRGAGREGGALAAATPSATSTEAVAGATARADDPSGAGSVDGTAPPADPPAAGAPADGGHVPTVTVPIDAVAELAEAVTARLSAVDAVDGEAVQPGEVGGPALRVEIELVNGSTAPLDLRGAVVNLYHGPQQTPATALTEPGGSPLPHGLEAGATATGAFVFAVPADARDDVRVELDVRAVGPVVLFAGAAQR
ncbi:hypothetical protein [Cellulomonas dongxiuzhuiae]|uniref:hypothetical protein n=1 Tax=Cellulomonas dongxiuzhuiae TaxID=2819979 RepID=UPI001AAEA991|nr:hypothetical protein [Cellulomonas dongxiuzhuiae]MBO3088923.1 hypothetical protein [Cellulomonas dongxiuzhuiae]